MNAHSACMIPAPHLSFCLKSLSYTGLTVQSCRARRIGVKARSVDVSPCTRLSATRNVFLYAQHIEKKFEILIVIEKYQQYVMAIGQSNDSKY